MGIPGNEFAVAGRLLPIQWRRTRQARRYILRVRSPGVLAITLPSHGSKRDALIFAEQQRGWIAGQLVKLAARVVAKDWEEGSEVWFRGNLIPVELDRSSSGLSVRFAGESMKLNPGTYPVREAVQRILHGVAVRELPERLRKLAARHDFYPHQIVIRNQRSRWGSCSIRKTISLNWRLVMAPDFVCDYILLHELCHLRVMSHSARFWSEVEKVCPDWKAAEKWIKQHARELW